MANLTIADHADLGVDDHVCDTDEAIEEAMLDSVSPRNSLMFRITSVLTHVQN